MSSIWKGQVVDGVQPTRPRFPCLRVHSRFTSRAGKFFVYRKRVLSWGQGRILSPVGLALGRAHGSAQQTPTGRAPQPHPGTPSPFPPPRHAPCTPQARRSPLPANPEALHLAAGPPPSSATGRPTWRPQPPASPPPARATPGFRLGLLGYRVASVAIATRTLGPAATDQQRA